MRPAWILSGMTALALASCVDDGGAEVSTKRGAPSAKGADGKAPAKAAAATTAKPAGGDAGGETEVLPSELPPRPPVALDAKSFSKRRDPFYRFVASDIVVPEPDRPRAARKVELPGYAFEDLKLVAIVTGRGLKPRAVFVGSDGRSRSIVQGQYFSSAEVLLAAVNRDYVEVEVVDDDLASSLNLQRGERRAVYLRNE